MSGLREPPSRAAGRRRDYAALLALAFVARLPRLGESLWYDEVYYSTHQRFSSWSKLLDSLASSIAAPLYRLLLFGWVELFGDQEVVVRLPSLVFGLGSVVLTYELARRWADLSTARLAAACLCLAPAHVWYSQEATPYAMVACLVLAAAWLGDRCAEHGTSWRGWGLYLAVLLAAVFTHYFALAALLPLTLVAGSAPARSRRRLLAAHALVAVAAVAMVAAKRAAGSLNTGQAFLRPFDAFEAWMLGGQWFLHGNTLWPLSPYRASPAKLLERPGLVALQVAAAAMLVAGIWRSVRAEQSARGWAPVIFLAVLPASLWGLTLAGYRQLYIERYVFWALPFFVLLVARGALAFGAERWRRAAVAFLVAVTAAAYVGWLVQDDRWTVYKPNPDWRSAAATLAARAAPGDPVLAIGVTPTLDLEYHLRRSGAKDVKVVNATSEMALLLGTRRGIRRYFLIENESWPGPFERRLAALEADPRVRHVAVHVHRNVRLHEFESRAVASRLPPAPTERRAPDAAPAD